MVQSAPVSAPQKRALSLKLKTILKKKHTLHRQPSADETSLAASPAIAFPRAPPADDGAATFSSMMDLAHPYAVKLNREEGQREEGDLNFTPIRARQEEGGRGTPDIQLKPTLREPSLAPIQERRRFLHVKLDMGSIHNPFHEEPIAEAIDGITLLQPLSSHLDRKEEKKDRCRGKSETKRATRKSFSLFKPGLKPVILRDTFSMTKNLMEREQALHSAPVNPATP
mmetsp:Transcript_1633/g.3341  ORF Transcript_1633/g.3341 Transcript_1633/m.3341 type:complete len:226 (-) Transcript_1633:410-1087(-)|eukprot:CAMPEP_0113881852 /NCGR_PEP_ID=MMETSP0780_2-20120614/8613_1 /TAXON_ID=652834 /ORGANISM="Palpitomonas bilix" /LENGTH=225 /DNA_ID=CAMNT_0000868769 /DNA_START=286 /DNA_END=963 /DNA_ORIENTATION=+ /assembly_acc=CAM_ASM_000599